MLSIENKRFIDTVTYLISNGIVKNKKDFAQKVNIHHQIIYDIYKGRLKPSSELLKLSEELFNINKSYILFGEGEMLKPTKKEEKVTETEEVIASSGNYKLVPLYNFDTVGGMYSSNDGMDAPSFIERYIPFIDARDEDMCIPITGNSMIPAYSPGSIVLLREVIHWREYFGYGHVFVLFLTDGKRIIKEVRKSTENPKDNVLCVSYNYESSAPEDLPKNMIYRVYKVIKVLTNEGF